MNSVKLSAFSDELEKIAFLGGLGKVVGKGLGRLATAGTGATVKAGRTGLSYRNAGAMASPGMVGGARRTVARVGEAAYTKPSLSATATGIRAKVPNVLKKVGPAVQKHTPPGMAQNMRLRAAQAGNWIKKNPMIAGAIGAGTVGAGTIGYNLAGQGRRQ